MDPWILWAREEMERRLHEPWILEHLAATMNLPLSRFTRLFSDSQGVAPAEYLHQLRLARAKILLERTFLSVTEVMRLVGLSDAKGFETDFHHTFGVAPHALRDQAWGSGARGR